MVEIKGLEKLAPKDFPGHISCTVFLGGCNFRCPFCHNADLVLNPSSLPSFPPDYILGFFDSRKNWLEGVCVTGGEPLLHDDLDVLLRVIKDRELLVKIDTNGTFPEKLEALVQAGLVDAVAMDVKAPLDRYGEAAGVPADTEAIRKSIDYLKHCDVDVVFRTTAVPGLIDSDAIEEIGRRLEGAKNFQIQQFKPVGTLDKSFEDLKPFKKEELQALADRAIPYFENVKIEGI